MTHTLFDYLVAARKAAAGDEHALDEYRAELPPRSAATLPSPPPPPQPPKDRQGGLGI